MSVPKISVVVPVYNVERFLDRCVQSLLNQTLKDIEIILVDDGSPDHCPQMCDKYALQDSRIKIVHKPNAGLGLARNSGLEVSMGEYVAFVDSDDYVDTSIYETLYREAIRNDADAVFCGFKTENLSGSWSDSKEVESATIFKESDLTNFMLDMVASSPKEQKERSYYMSVWHAIYRRRIIEDHDIKFLSERDVASEDIPFQVDFMKNAETIMYIPQNLYYYCLNSTSLTATFKREKYDRFKYLYFLLKDKLRDIEEGNVRADRFFIGYCRTQLHHLQSSDVPKKLHEVKRITHDEIWDYFRMNYPIENFARKDLKLMYWLILHRFNRLLLFNSFCVNTLRRLKSRLS